MRRTILLDLDNTLLNNDMKDFLPPYFAGLNDRLSHFLKGQDIRQLMVASVQVTQTNQDPAVTNMDAFMADFCRRVNVSIDEIQAILERFYQEDYPQLCRYTSAKPEARQVVRHLAANGYKVVIATNPLFPATAIEQRLAWAGLADFDFALVTSMENSHFSKPNPRYYEEILLKTNSRPETTWMVGDDPVNDIAPAQTIGLKTWWITQIDGHSSRSIQTDKRGTLADFLAWIEAGGLSPDAV